MSDRRTPVALATNPLRGSSPGYSLVELMAFMAVMVTLAAFIMPFTRSSLNAMNLTSDARNRAERRVARQDAGGCEVHAGARCRDPRQRTLLMSSAGGRIPAGWITEGVVQDLSSNVSFGFAGIAAPPPNTQPVIGQAAACLDAAGAADGRHRLHRLQFSRRARRRARTLRPPTGAYYLGDGATVYGVTTTTGGMVQLWRIESGRRQLGAQLGGPMTSDRSSSTRTAAACDIRQRFDACRSHRGDADHGDAGGGPAVDGRASR